MAFPVQPHSAEKVQHDINTILETIARFLSKIRPPELLEESQEPLQLNAELEPDQGLVIDAEVISEVEALPYHNPALLKGNTAYPQLVPEVRLQLNHLYMAVPLPQLQQSLEQLSPERLATLAGAIASPALPPATDHEEVIDIEVDGVQCFHQEHGHVTINGLLSADESEQNGAIESLQKSDNTLQQPPNTLEVVRSSSEIQQIQDTVITTEIGERQLEQLTTELRPVGEVESLTGQGLGDLSTLHHEVLHHAPSIRVERDQYGNIKGSTAIRAVVEPTEDEIEADAEYRAEHPLTPEAKAIAAQLRDYFEMTGEKALAGKRDYDIQADGDRILFIPRENPTEVITIQGDQAASVSSERIEHLMVRFAAAYESIRTTEQISDRDFEWTR